MVFSSNPTLKYMLLLKAALKCRFLLKIIFFSIKMKMQYPSKIIELKVKIVKKFKRGLAFFSLDNT